MFFNPNFDIFWISKLAQNYFPYGRLTTILVNLIDWLFQPSYRVEEETDYVNYVD